MYDDAVEL